ncbi:MAG TPA: integrase [Methylococcales bacterium]|nr:integrase [Methylococcales bacterium]
MAYVEPIIDKNHIKKASRFIKDNFDGAYHLIWKLGTETGLRITDLCELEYSNFDYDNRTVKIAENKGTRANKARAKLKVLEQVKNELIALFSSDTNEMMKVFITKPKDIYSLIPDTLKPLIDVRIKDAEDKAPVKYRVAKIGLPTITKIQARQRKYSKIDNGQLFSRSTLSSNRARNIAGVISRQACYKVFSQLTEFMATLGTKVKIACHSLRKIFARHLYVSSGNNIGLLMKVLGHSSEQMSLKYIGINQDEELDAIDNMLNYMNA